MSAVLNADSIPETLVAFTGAAEPEAANDANLHQVTFEESHAAAMQDNASAYRGFYGAPKTGIAGFWQRLAR